MVWLLLRLGRLGATIMVAAAGGQLLHRHVQESCGCSTVTRSLLVVFRLITGDCWRGSSRSARRVLQGAFWFLLRLRLSRRFCLQERRGRLSTMRMGVGFGASAMEVSWAWALSSIMIKVKSAEGNMPEVKKLCNAEDMLDGDGWCLMLDLQAHWL